MEFRKTHIIKNWKQAAVIFILSVFAFPSALQARNKSDMFGMYKNHHYVYYPKQNFYYDPYSYSYVVVEDDVWVRRVEPPREVASINVNVLPHVDVYVDSYYPHEANKRHKQKYKLVRYTSPSTEFYVNTFPLRFDFSITPYQFYRPSGRVKFVEYNPNLYYHPGRGHAYGHGKRPHFHTVDNRHPYYHYYDKHDKHGFDKHGPKARGNGHSNHGSKHNPGDFHQKGNKPSGSSNWGKKPSPKQNNDKRPGDFHQNNQNKGDNRNPGDFHQKNQNKGNDRNPGDFHQKNEQKNAPAQQNDRKPGDFHNKGGQPSSPSKGGKKGAH